MPAVRVAVLASGSAGNCTYVEVAGTRLLIDAGLSARSVGRRLASVPGGPSLNQIDAVLITHEHADHAAYAAELGELGLPVYATRGTALCLGLFEAHAVVPGATFEIGEVAIRSIGLPHDAAEPVGYVLEGEGRRVGYLTDCGHTSPLIEESFANLDIFVLESNHDEQLLRSGPYPPSLKRRIGSSLGHLSNAQVAALLRGLRRRLPRALLLAHLSQVNNRPRLARQAAIEAMGRTGSMQIEVARQQRISSVAQVDRRGVTFDPIPAGQQMELFV